MTHFAAGPDRRVVARETARILLEVGAVSFYRDTPFVFTSGWKSPVYTDCRKLIGFPRARAALMDFAVATIFREVGYESLDVVAGGETAGIPFAAWISERLSLPMQYVRKKPKGFGRDAQIEGRVVPGARTLLVEDLATDGRSKLLFAEAIRAAGQTVAHCFVVFFYDIFPGSRETLADAGLTLHALTTWWDVLEAATAAGTFDAGVLAEVEGYLHGPAAWSAAHGGMEGGGGVG